MASLALWFEGARPRTLPAAVSPVVAGTGAAAYADTVVAAKAALALLVALALQVGVNYANDYSDGIRGTDAHRVGPRRLVGSGVASPGAVRLAAFGSFGVAAVAGLLLAATSGWWLLAVGAGAIAAAWFYTAGTRPYGYRGLGEAFVFCFFGLVSVCGTTYVQAGRVTGPSVLAAVATGSLACAILVANNLRDIPTDEAAGKRTLAVLLGGPASRALYLALVVIAFGLLGPLALATYWTLLGLAALPLAVRAARPVLSGAVGAALLPTLRDTGLTELVWSLGVATGLAVGAT